MSSRSHLGELLNEFVFVGGATVELWITDEAAPEFRPTDDVDVIVEITTRTAYYRFEELLRAAGFQHDQESGLLCRFKRPDSYFSPAGAGAGRAKLHSRQRPSATELAGPRGIRRALTLRRGRGSEFPQVPIDIGANMQLIGCGRCGFLRATRDHLADDPGVCPECAQVLEPLTRAQARELSAERRKAVRERRTAQEPR